MMTGSASVGQGLPQDRSALFTQANIVYKQRIMVNNNESLHNRLALFRAEAGLSRKDLAEQVGVNPQTIGFLERGQYGPSLELGLKLARVFGVPVETLFSLEPFAPLAESLAAPRLIGGGRR